MTIALLKHNGKLIKNNGKLIKHNTPLIYYTNFQNYDPVTQIDTPIVGQPTKFVGFDAYNLTKGTQVYNWHNI